MCRHVPATCSPICPVPFSDCLHCFLFFCIFVFLFKELSFSVPQLGLLALRFSLPRWQSQRVSQEPRAAPKKGKISSRGRESATYRGTSRFYLNSFGLFVDPESSTCPSPPPFAPRLILIAALMLLFRLYTKSSEGEKKRRCGEEQRKTQNNAQLSIKCDNIYNTSLIL